MTTHGQTSRSHSAASYAPSEYDSDGSLHTIDDDSDGALSSYEDCIDDGRDETGDGHRSTATGSGLIDPYIGARRRFVDIGDDDVTFRMGEAGYPDPRDSSAVDADRRMREYRAAAPERPNSMPERDQITTTARRRVDATAGGRNEPTNRRHTSPITDRPYTSGDRDLPEGRRGFTFAEQTAYKTEWRAQDDDHRRENSYDYVDHSS